VVPPDALAVIDALLGYPFPPTARVTEWRGAGRERRSGPFGFSTPNAHRVLLHESPDFFGDLRNSAAEESIWAEFERHLRTLVSALSARWGEPDGHISVDELIASGGPPVLLGAVWRAYASDVWVWHRGRRSVWAGLRQEDRELPIELYAVIAKR
jgi:hypothetical protein